MLEGNVVVFHHDYAAAHSYYPADLIESTLPIRDMHKYASTMDVVKISVGKRKLFERCALEHDRRRIVSCGTCLGPLKYRVGNINSYATETTTDQPQGMIANSAAGVKEERAGGRRKLFKDPIESQVVKAPLVIVAINSFP
jgi:hypothetical protein